MEAKKQLESVKQILSPQACYSPQTLRNFLRLSRKHSDDSLATALPRVGSCSEQISENLFPAWYARDTIIEYCNDIADKNLAEKQKLAKEQQEQEQQKSHEKIDPRFDAYGARDEGRVDPFPEEEIKSWVEKERMVESIIREDSARFLASKCGPVFLNTSPTSTRLATDFESYVNAYNAFKLIHQYTSD